LRASNRNARRRPAQNFARCCPTGSGSSTCAGAGKHCWIPLGDLDLGLGYENQTSYPAPGEIILYPGGISETEILLAYGGVRFASKVGQLAGNHFLTVIEGVDQLRPLGKCVLWEGAQDILFEAL
jgi:uncharacterized protein DUF3830